MRMHQGGAKTSERAERVADKPPSRKVASRKIAKVDPALYDDYAAVYRVAGLFLTITRKGERLFGQATGQLAVELFPESETKFFVKVGNLQVTFVRDAKGTVDGLILHQGGRDIRGQRLPAVEIK